MTRHQRNSWSEAEDNILIERWNAFDDPAALSQALPGRQYDAIKARVKYLRSCGIKLLPRRANAEAEARRKAAFAESARLRREARERERAQHIDAHSLSAYHVDWPALGHILFTDDPRARADRGTGKLYTQKELNHSVSGSSAAWAAQV